MNAILTPTKINSGRGTGRVTATRWYRVQMGGYEPIIHDDGTTSQEFVLEGFCIEVPDTFLGFGTRDRIEAAAAERYPDRNLIDWWPIGRPVQ